MVMSTEELQALAAKLKAAREALGMGGDQNEKTKFEKPWAVSGPCVPG
jgi:hypothetical protein